MSRLRASSATGTCSSCLRELAAAAEVKEDEQPVLLLDIDMPSTVLFWFEGWAGDRIG